MIIIDTHVLIWWLTDSTKLSSKAKKALEENKRDFTIYISSISIWEIGQLIKKGRIGFDINIKTWTKNLQDLPFLHFVPINNEIALESIFLSFRHKDPADRFIVATAKSLNCPLVTSDRKIRDSKLVKTIW